MVRLAPDARYRISKRGLVLAGETGETVLFEHPRAADLPDLLGDDPTSAVLVSRLGPPLDDTVVDDLLDLGILTDRARPQRNPSRHRSVSVTRSGLLIRGIATPARLLDRYLVPVLLHPAGAVAIAAVVLSGVVALLTGRPTGLPAVSSAPAVEALLMITIGTAATVCHELAHAVALHHFGRIPLRAGFGFYWGALSFFVDSTPALTLPRRQRVIQALVGLAVDVVTTAAFAIAAHLLVSHPLIAIVLWRLAILRCVDIAVNLAPILQVDGHWAFADYLDEPDLGPRARRAAGRALRGRLPDGQRALAGYGVFSLIVGIALIAIGATVFWINTSDLVVALFIGDTTDILIGVYYVGPLVLGVAFSVLGLLLETLSVGVDRHTLPPSAFSAPDDATHDHG